MNFPGIRASAWRDPCLNLQDLVLKPVLLSWFPVLLHTAVMWRWRARSLPAVMLDDLFSHTLEFPQLPFTSVASLGSPAPQPLLVMRKPVLLSLLNLVPGLGTAFIHALQWLPSLSSSLLFLLGHPLSAFQVVLWKVLRRSWIQTWFLFRESPMLTSEHLCSLLFSVLWEHLWRLSSCLLGSQFPSCHHFHVHPNGAWQFSLLLYSAVYSQLSLMLLSISPLFSLL